MADDSSTLISNLSEAKSKRQYYRNSAIDRSKLSFRTPSSVVTAYARYWELSWRLQMARACNLGLQVPLDPVAHEQHANWKFKCSWNVLERLRASPNPILSYPSPGWMHTIAIILTDIVWSWRLLVATWSTWKSSDVRSLRHDFDSCQRPIKLLSAIVV